MSYSFSVRGETKSAATSLVRDEMDKVVQGQSVHQKDLQAAVDVASGLICLLADDETKDVLVSMGGYLSWNTSDEKIQTANVAVTASLVEKVCG